MFKLNLVITEKCCLACKYCYCIQNPNAMTKEIVDSTMERIPELLDIFGFKTYDLVYFGGEPLENFELIKYTHSLDKPKCDMELMISNLLLLNYEKLQYFKNNNIGVSWSFDGLWNEFNRPLTNGESSLPLYIKKLPIIKQITHSCKVMVSPYSVDTMVENFRYFIDELKIYNPDYSLVRDDIWNEDDINKFKIELHKLADVYIEYYRKGISVSNGFFSLPILDTIVGKCYGKRKFGCFVGNSGVAVMPNGDIYGCERFGTNKLYCYGNVKEKLDKDKFKQINSEIYLNPYDFEECKNCKLYNYCNTGCTYSQLQNNKKPLECVCKLYHIMYKEALYVYNELNKDTNYKEFLLNMLKNGG